MENGEWFFQFTIHDIFFNVASATPEFHKYKKNGWCNEIY